MKVADCSAKSVKKASLGNNGQRLKKAQHVGLDCKSGNSRWCLFSLEEPLDVVVISARNKNELSRLVAEDDSQVDVEACLEKSFAQTTNSDSRRR